MAISPLAVRRMAERGEDITGIRPMTRMGTVATRIITGQEDLSLWDDDELQHGRRRDRNGNFGGSDPQLVPKLLQNEITKRIFAKANELMRNNLVMAVEELMLIVKGADTENKDKLKAIQMIMDRTMGKEVQRIEISEKKRWEITLDSSIMSVTAIPADDIIDAESEEMEVDDDSEEDDSDSDSDEAVKDFVDPFDS